MNIKENSKILKLSYVYNNYEDEIKEAKQIKKDHGKFLDELLEKEIVKRKENIILVRNPRSRKNTLCNRIRNKSMHRRKKCIIYFSTQSNNRAKRSNE